MLRMRKSACIAVSLRGAFLDRLLVDRYRFRRAEETSRCSRSKGLVASLDLSSPQYARQRYSGQPLPCRDLKATRPFPAARSRESSSTGSISRTCAQSVVARRRPLVMDGPMNRRRVLHPLEPVNPCVDSIRSHLRFAGLRSGRFPHWLRMLWPKN